MNLCVESSRVETLQLQTADKLMVSHKARHELLLLLLLQLLLQLLLLFAVAVAQR